VGTDDGSSSLSGPPSPSSFAALPFNRCRLRGLTTLSLDVRQSSRPCSCHQIPRTAGSGAIGDGYHPSDRIQNPSLAHHPHASWRTTMSSSLSLTLCLQNILQTTPTKHQEDPPTTGLFLVNHHLFLASLILVKVTPSPSSLGLHYISSVTSRPAYLNDDGGPHGVGLEERTKMDGCRLHHSLSRPTRLGGTPVQYLSKVRYTPHHHGGPNATLTAHPTRIPPGGSPSSTRCGRWG
jgi:hypothetical protein